MKLTCFRVPSLHVPPHHEALITNISLKSVDSRRKSLQKYCKTTEKKRTWHAKRRVSLLVMNNLYRSSWIFFPSKLVFYFILEFKFYGILFLPLKRLNYLPFTLAYNIRLKYKFYTQGRVIQCEKKGTCGEQWLSIWSRGMTKDLSETLLSLSEKRKKEISV